MRLAPAEAVEEAFAAVGDGVADAVQPASTAAWLHAPANSLAEAVPRNLSGAASSRVRGRTCDAGAWRRVNLAVRPRQDELSQS